jgi:ankyrin repeat protein
MEEVEQPLHEAARRGNLNFMRECLKQGVSGTGLDSAGNTPLYWASHAGHVDCVQELLALPKPAVNVQVSDTRRSQQIQDMEKVHDSPCHSPDAV